MSPEASSDPAAVAAIISAEMVRIHRDSYGQPAAAKTYVFDDLVVSVIDIELLPNEKVLVEAGDEELVRQVRHGFQKAIRAAFTAAVERATGRTVVAFVSDTHVDPDFSVELFRLDGTPTSDLPDV